MGRKRKTSKHLPERMYQYSNNGSYYYKQQDGKTHNLGKIYSSALVLYSSVIHPLDDNYNDYNYMMTQHIDRYMVKVSLKTKAQSTHEKELPRAALLKESFGKLLVTEVTMQHVAQYMTKRLESVGASANRELSLLSHMFKIAIDWGFNVVNPTRDISRFKEKGPKDKKKLERYVRDDELILFRNHCHEWMQLYLDFKVMTGLRNCGILGLKINAVQADGFFVAMPGKNSDSILFEWTDELHRVVDRMLSYANKVNSEYFFSNSNGAQRTYSSFSSAWYRAKKKAIPAGLRSNFPAERYLRNKSVTDAPDIAGASDKIGHSDIKTTKNNYAMLGSRTKPFSRSMENIIQDAGGL
jgi:integrase